MEDLMENEILQYLIFDDSGKSEKNRMEMIVREFCPPLSNKNPARIEKLLNVMNFKEPMKLYIILPAGLLTSEDLSSHSKMKPFILDFVEDARDLIKMEKKDILEILLEHLVIGHTKEAAVESESALLKILETNIKKI